jgi:hypothetical protein
VAANIVGGIIDDRGEEDKGNRIGNANYINFVIGVLII